MDRIVGILFQSGFDVIRSISCASDTIRRKFWGQELSNGENIDVKMISFGGKYLSAYKEHCNVFICLSAMPSMIKQFAK